MRIGVMSDTHGNYSLMQKAADQMVEDFEVDAIVHLGDDFADVAHLDAHGKTVYAVPGIYEEAWNDRNVPRRLIEKFEGIQFLLSHTPNSDKCGVRGFDVLLHGHTHVYGAARSDDRLITINPGHLKSNSDKDRPATYAILDIEGNRLLVRFMDMDGETLEQCHYEI